jgi:NAD(P) transhydrogenase subunit beta
MFSPDTDAALLELIYLIGSTTFILGLKMLGHPDTARRGNLIAAGGMGLAILGTLLLYDNQSTTSREPLKVMLILGGIGIGTVVGWLAAKRVKMTAMPQMVSLFNGLGGACAMLLAIIELQVVLESHHEGLALLAMIFFTLFFGAVAFSGSMLAYAKLEELIKDKTLVLPRHNIFNLFVLAGILGLMIYTIVAGGENTFVLGLIVMGLALFYGVSFVAPIGGADMPVVISLLNSFTGMTAAAAGLLYGNMVMQVGGILVGASGTILTVLMCNAMNRSLLNVLIGSFGGSTAASGKEAGEQVVREISRTDAAVQLNYSQSVMIVPGYGLAVAQAQKICRELDDLLESNGVEVRYAIHPVAGRMPGHMNVLLAEANVPYTKLIDLDEANELLPNTDVVVVVGANDVVNPAALDDPSSPIYGMPILHVHEAKHIVVLKRSMRSGYAGIENELFFHPKTKMLFGDAKDSLQGLVNEVKAL